MAKKQKRSFITRLLAEFLFWVHFLISVAILVMGLFISWYWVIVVIVALRVHQVLLHNCVLTLLEQREGGLPKGTYYYQLLAKRFFGFRLKKKYVFPVLIIHYSLAILITVVATIYGFRLHL